MFDFVFILYDSVGEICVFGSQFLETRRCFFFVILCCDLIRVRLQEDLHLVLAHVPQLLNLVKFYFSLNRLVALCVVMTIQSNLICC